MLHTINEETPRSLMKFENEEALLWEKFIYKKK